MPDGAATRGLAALSGVRHVGEFRPGYRLAPALREALRRDGVPPGDLTLEVSLFADADPVALSQAVEQRLGVSVESIRTRQPPRLRLFVRADRLAKAVGALIRDPAVQFVEPRHEAIPHNDQVAWIVQSYDRVNGPVEAVEADPKAYASTATLWNRGLRGEGQIAAVNDVSFEAATCFFDDPAHAVVPQIVPPPGALAVHPDHRKIVALNGVTPQAFVSTDAFSHGSHVASTVAGDDLANLADGSSAGHDHGDGVAPAARLVLQDISQAISSICSATIEIPSLEDLLDQEYDAGARVSNNSWGTGGSDYGVVAGEIDRAMFRHEDFLVVFSAGNAGGSGVRETAQCKNCIVVGATENWDDGFNDVFGGLDPENMAAFSSLGPAADGRLRPDVTAPGYLVRSNRFPTAYVSDENDPQCIEQANSVCFPEFGGCYLIDTTATCPVVTNLGTSMSAPVIAGLGLLTRQYFMEGFHPSGIPTPEHARTPSAALVKAVLINSARNMTGHRYERRGGSPTDFGALADAPSNVQGWGAGRPRRRAVLCR